MRVNLDDVGCRSAFDLSPKISCVLPLGTTGGGDADIHMVELEDVVYLPNVLESGQSLCVAKRAFVPAESVIDCWNVDFVKQSRATIPAFRAKYSDEFEADFFDEPVCILGNVFSRNFGHWTTEELWKVSVLESSGTDCRYVTSNLPAFAHESLAFLGIDKRRILSVDRPTVFARTIFITAISLENIGAFPGVLHRFRELVHSRLGDGASRYGKRLWLDRVEMVRNGGAIVNRDEVRRCIERYGFDILDMAPLPVAEQWRAASGASIIGGAHGSQFVHAQFMPSSSTVIECFSPMHVNPSILQICRLLKHSYHQIVARSHVVAPYSHGRNCVVDCEHLELVLDALPNS